MRYRKYRNNAPWLLQEWVRKTFTFVGAKKNNKKNTSELNGLSEHLLDDLGFDRKGRPLKWSSFLPEKPKFACLELPVKKAGVGLQNHQVPGKNCCP